MAGDKEMNDLAICLGLKEGMQEQKYMIPSVPGKILKIFIKPFQASIKLL